ncbi:MAG: hypothetical protein JSV88_34105 [Candidatus Aminicenantes bacterium]|nr:MAG: hypothetical protein JSV88_34105 [Candidatus Aminicenantes bacterium]
MSKQILGGTIAFSPDGKTLASGSEDNTIFLWDTVTGNHIKTLRRHTDWVTFVCFSPDGKTLASGSWDGTLQLQKLIGPQWTLSKIFVPGSQGNWLSIDTIENRLMRGDDGTLLVTKDESGSIKPVPPPVPPKKGTLELINQPGPLQTLDGQATPFSLQLKNSGQGKIYWIQVIKDHNREQTNTIGNRKNPLVFYPPKTHIKLEPGETTTLPCQVSALSDYTNPSGQSALLYLKIISTYNSTQKPLSLEIPVTVQTPTLDLLEAKVQKQDQTVLLVARFQNIGAQNLPADTQFSGKANNYSLDEIKHPEIIQPGAAKDISFVIPASLEIDKNTRINLIARKTTFPIHEWEFKDVPLIFPTFWHLYVLGVMIFLGILVGIYYLRYYRHPLILGLSEKPAGLLHLHPGELTRARRLFFPAPRLETLLTSVGISRGRYNKALAFYHDPRFTPAQKCQYLAQRLEASAEPISENEIYIYKLQLPPDFILNMDRCLLVYPPVDMEEADILGHIKKIEVGSSQVCLIILPYERYQSGLYQTAKKFDNWLVVPELPILTELLLSPTPLDVFARLVSSQIKVTRISPYQTGGGVNKEAIFFGRQQLLAHIMQREPANYLLVGGRQLGKSSLLKAIDRRYQNIPSMECYYITLSKEEIANHLAGALKLPPGTPLDQVLENMSQGPKRLFLIDEADRFIAAEAQTGFTTLQHFRSLSEERKCYFIFAGFWDLYHAVTFDYQSPLKNFGETLFIEALEAEACRELATKPMEMLNIHYESAELVEILVQETGRRANLVAVTCSEILNKLDMTDRLICQHHLEATFDHVKYSALGGWEKLTLNEETNRLDRIIVYSSISKDTFTQTTLMNILETHGCSYEPEQVKQSLARLELAFILKREKQNYTYCVPLFKKMVQEQNPEVLLSGELKALR